MGVSGWEGNGGEQGIYDIYAAQVPPLAEPRPDCILSGIDINDNLATLKCF